jgi:hypothetical protein
VSSLDNEQALTEVPDFSTTDTDLTYRILAEPLLTAALVRLSNAQSGKFFDRIVFQLYSCFRNQDRHVMETWDLPGGTSTSIAIFDGTTVLLCSYLAWTTQDIGHSGHGTVDRVLQLLPSSIKQSPHFALESRGIQQLSSDTVSRFCQMLWSMLMTLSV